MAKDSLGEAEIRERGPVEIGPREVHVRGVWLNAGAEALAQFSSSLSAEELYRADRFSSETLKSSYIFSRGGLRMLLAHYLGRRPNEIELVRGPKGKPALSESSRIQFNTSHSGQMALYAFTLGCEVGVDVEHLRELDDAESLASRFFSPGEISELLSLSPKEMTQAFFRCWTRKEAYIKAVGGGLSIPLDRFQVTLLQGVPARLVQIADDLGNAADWTLHHLEPAPGYVGALAYQDSPRPVTIYPTMRAEDLCEMQKRRVRPI